MKYIDSLPPLIKKMLKSATLLTVFVIIGIIFLLITKLITNPAIEKAKVEEMKIAFNQVLSSNEYDNSPFEDQKIITDIQAFKTPQPIVIYRARKNKQPVALIIETIAPDGYSGNIKIMVAIKNDNRVSGVRILEHKETPGLGDKIEIRKDDWVTKFNGMSVRDDNLAKWRVKKDGGQFDQFTGATITPRAVVKAVKNTILYVTEHKKELYD
jgi:electron transport complex protein RnfG